MLQRLLSTSGPEGCEFDSRSGSPCVRREAKRFGASLSMVLKSSFGPLPGGGGPSMILAAGLYPACTD